MRERIFFNAFWVLMWILPSVALALPPDVLFDRNYPESGEFAAVMVGDSGETYLAGTAVQGSYRFYIVRVDTSGSSTWTRTYGGGDHLTAMLSMADNNLAFIGYTTDNATLDYRLMRLSTSGSLLGTYAFGGNTSQDIAYAILQRPDGRLLVAGETQLPDSARQMSLTNVSTQGSVSWARALPPASAGVRLELDGDSGIFVYGTADSTDSLSGSDMIWVQTDSSGLRPEYHRFAGAQEEYCADAIRISGELTLLVGAARPVGGAWDIRVLATNDSGDSLWSRTYGTPANDVALAVAPTADLDSGFVMAGWSEGGPSGQKRGILMKLNRQGDSLWTLFAPTDVESEFADVVQDSLWRYHAGGHIHSDVSHGYYLVTEPDPRSPGTHPPMQFSLVAPAEDSLVSSRSVNFNWEQAADPDSADTVRYSLELAFDTLFANPTAFSELDSNRFTWNIDTDDVRLYWRVSAEDRQDHVRLCRERFRSLRVAIPDSTSSFDLLFPDSGTALPQPLSEFRWSRAQDPDANDSVMYDIHFLVGDTGLTFTGLRDTFINVSFVGNPVIGEADTVLWYVDARSFTPPMTVESLERWTFVSWSSSVDDIAPLVLRFDLGVPFPNPFNSTVTLRYEVDKLENVQLDVYSLDGRRIVELMSETHSPGRYEVQWNAGPAASGMYFVRLSAKDRVRTAKMILMK